MQSDTDEWKEMAQQLSCPNGERGVAMGEKMDNTNGNMIRRTIDSLEISDNDTILEIGHGNASHAGHVLTKGQHVQYFGIDISEVMVQEAIRINAGFVASGNASFQHTDGEHIFFDNSYFNKVFTVNTIYFWKNPKEYLHEISRVLKAGGGFNLAFVQKNFMERLPFSKYGFQLYDPGEAEVLLKDTGFSVKNIISETEAVISNTGETVQREFVIIKCNKP